jgi:hypothetical protein
MFAIVFCEGPAVATSKRPRSQSPEHKNGAGRRGEAFFTSQRPAFRATAWNAGLAFWARGWMIRLQAMYPFLPAVKLTA